MRLDTGDRAPFFARMTLTLIGGLLVGGLTWAAYAEVDEITRGDGRVIPFSRTQIVQATEAGVVQEIAVHLGQVVRQGDLIVRLDDTSTTAALGESQAKATALKARIARLRLEQAGELSNNYTCPEDVEKSAPAVCRNEEKLLEAKRRSYENKLSVLQARLDQRRRESDELSANITRLEDNIAVSEKELALIKPMADRKLVARTDLLRIERDLTEQSGQLNLARESIGRLEAAIREAELQVAELSLLVRQEASTELTSALAELSIIEETIRGASDRVARTDIRSPVDGIVNTLDVTTVGAFVQPGSVIAGIVPTSDKLLIETRISPRDVAFIRPQQRAIVKISAYDFSIFGGLEGRVVNISADSLVDQKTNEPFYLVQVQTERSELRKDGRNYAIIPGMICTAEIITGRKTILHYLLKPINKARNEALRER